MFNVMFLDFKENVKETFTSSPKLIPIPPQFLPPGYSLISCVSQCFLSPRGNPEVAAGDKLQGSHLSVSLGVFYAKIFCTGFGRGRQLRVCPRRHLHEGEGVARGGPPPRIEVDTDRQTGRRIVREHVLMKPFMDIIVKSIVYSTKRPDSESSASIRPVHVRRIQALISRNGLILIDSTSPYLTNSA